MTRIIRIVCLINVFFTAVAIGALPEPWQGQDIGDVGATGSSSYSDGVFTISGSGADIWDTTDAFHYVYQSYSGDVQLITQVTSQTYTDGWAKAGLMIREEIPSTNSKHAMMIISAGNGSSFQYRASTGGYSNHVTPGNGLQVPCWLMLIRTGNEFKGYSSEDGITWTLIGTTTIDMTSNVYVGLCVTAHNYGLLSTAEFENVSVGTDTTPPSPNPATWSEEPNAIDSNMITMTATEGTDDSGLVEYYFEETSGNYGGSNSGWLSNPAYTDKGLRPATTYTYVARMRDATGNTTIDSQTASATTQPSIDLDNNRFIDVCDLSIWTDYWLEVNCPNNLWCGGTDFDMSGDVAFPDFGLLAQVWLQSYGGLGHFHEWAMTPPMGWNSWDCFGTSVTEDEVKANADYMAQYLKQYGWEYVVVDIQWYEPQVESNPYYYPYPPNTNIDGYGRVIPAENKHPSSAGGNGFIPLAEYVHGLGLKFGVHMMRGIPRKAYDLDTPILGTSYTARDIADTGSTCSWNPDMYGVDTTQPGAQEYYNSIFNLLAEWGVDYVKIDDISRPYHQEEIEAIRNAIDQCGRAIVFSTSPGATPLSAGEHVSEHANLWRISDDFWDNWVYLDPQFQRLHDWSQWNADGHYPDADMLPLGNIRARSNGWTNFTETEQKTMMILWAIARSPLMMGGHMPNNDAYTLSLMTNSEHLYVNQHSINNRCIQNNSYPIWTADVRDDSNEVYLAVFNRTSTGPTPVQVTLSQVEVKQSNLGIKRCEVRDLWTHTDLGEFTDTFSPNVDAHGSGLYKLTVLETVP